MDIVTDTANAPARRQEILTICKSGEAVLAHTGEDPLIVRAKILKLASDLIAMPGEKLEFKVEHVFAKGMYLRKLFIPKGSILVGKIHRKECLNIVSKGDITVLTESGCARVTAGFTVVSPAGIQKVGYAHEDTEFINVFLTDEVDIEKLENEIACESFEALNIMNNTDLICQ